MIPVGVIVNCLAVITGGVFGAFAGQKLPEHFKYQLNMILGLCSICMGIPSVASMKNMPAVIFAVVLGTSLGLAVNLGKWINAGACQLQKPVSRFFAGDRGTMSREEFLSSLVTILVLFCASGTGIYGCLDAGMTGDSSILISKSILDLFTAAIFACNLGLVVSLVAVPQFLIFVLLLLCSRVILPMTTPDMIADFRACGGILMLATGFRILKIKEFPIADMLPAMVLVMPFSFLWSQVVLPLL